MKSPDYSKGVMIALYPNAEKAKELALGTDGAESPDDLHVTLAFIGERGKDDVPDKPYWAELHDAAKEVAKRHPPQDAGVNGVGQFPEGDNGRPYVGVVGSNTIHDLHRDLTSTLKAKGVPVSDKFAFVPHMTFAYMHDGEDFPDHLDGPVDLTFDKMVVKNGDVTWEFPFGKEPAQKVASYWDDDTSLAWEQGKRLAYTDPEEEVNTLDPHSLEGTKLWWRIHPKDRPLHDDDAWSEPLNPYTGDDKEADEVLSTPRRGYSAFPHPYHVKQYADAVKWHPYLKSHDLIAFEGQHIGYGVDGEPLVMPTSQPKVRIPWEDAKDYIEKQPKPKHVLDEEQLGNVDYDEEGYPYWDGGEQPGAFTRKALAPRRDYYHVARSVVRDSIKQHGINHALGHSPWDDDPVASSTDAPGNYLFSDLQLAYDYADGMSARGGFGGADIWRVNPGKRNFDRDEEEWDVGGDDSRHVDWDPVPAENVELYDHVCDRDESRCPHGDFRRKAQFQRGPVTDAVPDPTDVPEHLRLDHDVKPSDVEDSGMTPEQWHEGLHGDRYDQDLAVQHWHYPGRFEDQHKPTHTPVGNVAEITYSIAGCSCGWTSNIRSDQATNNAWRRHIMVLDDAARREKAGEPHYVHPAPKTKRHGAWMDQVTRPYQDDAIAEEKNGTDPVMPPLYQEGMGVWPDDKIEQQTRTVKPVDVFSNPKTGTWKVSLGVLYIRDHGSKTFHVFDEESKEIECGHPMPPEHSGEDIWVDKPRGDMICADCKTLHRNRWADEMAAFDAFDRRDPNREHTASGDEDFEQFFNNPDHDYDPSWDYEVDEHPHPSVVAAVEKTRPKLEETARHLGMGKPSIHYIKGGQGVATYAHGTAPHPVLMVDGGQHLEHAPDDLEWGVHTSLFHEFGHGIEDWMEREPNEDAVEEYANSTWPDNHIDATDFYMKNYDDYEPRR